jgi:hypothetical protein
MNVFRTAQNSGAFIGHGLPWDLLSYFPYPRPLRVFAQTTDRAVVTWGPALASDTIVLHFVSNTRHSYLRGRMGHGPNRRNWGLTFTHGSRTGSEFYETVQDGDGAVPSGFVENRAKFIFDFSGGDGGDGNPGAAAISKT